MPISPQPNASQLPDELLSAVLLAAEADVALDAATVSYRDEHSNDFAEIAVPGGRSLIVKRARYEWAAPRFATSRIAARLIRQRRVCEAPSPLQLEQDCPVRPLEAYWKIDRPTLDELWPRLSEAQRTGALRSWGRLAARLHAVRLRGFGPLSDPATQARSLGEYLQQELEHRLQPAVAGEWPSAVPVVEAAVAAVPVITKRVGEDSRLVHNDMHMGNVLCDVADGVVECVGLIDLETAVAAPAEAEVAGIEIHHGTVVSRTIEGDWRKDLRAGYGRKLDEMVLRFYRVLHLLNMGFYSALIGHEWHAEELRKVAEREQRGLARAPRMEVVIG